MTRSRALLVMLLLALAWGCDVPPAFSPPGGPAKMVALDVRLPLYALGRWTVDNFSATLAAELGKYNIAVADARSKPEVALRIDLGQFTYRQWQEIDVVLLRGNEPVTEPAHVRVPDTEMTTLDVAAQLVAGIAARWIWSNAGAAPIKPQAALRTRLGAHA